MHKSPTFYLVGVGLLSLAFLLPRPAAAAWPTDPLVNVPLCTAPGNQYSGTIVSDGAGGAIVAWEDYRNGSADIYAQRVSATGTVQWATDGVALCTASGNQFSPTIVADGAGGAIVTWTDSRSQGNRIYAQRISARGSVQWTANGVALSTDTGGQSFPAIVADGAGGAIVTWQDYRSSYSGSGINIFAQRISAAGTVQWTADGVALCTAIGDQSVPTIVADDAGGAIVAWMDHRNNADWDIYAQRISPAGTAQWMADGVALCTSAGDQQTPRVVADGAGGAIVAWSDGRDGNFDIYAQRISPAGTVQWTANGAALCVAAGDQVFPAVTTDGEGGAIVTWQDRRSSVSDTGDDIYAQRISAAGTVQWTADGVALCTAPGAQYYPTIVSDNAGGAIVTWSDPRSGNYDIYAQRIAAGGAVQWTENGVAICAAPADQLSSTIASDGAAGAIVTWYDYRRGNADIYAQWVGGERGFIGPEPNILSVRDVPADQGGWVRIKWGASYRDRMPSLGISIYGIWRQVEASSALKAVAAGAKLVSSADGSADAQPRTFRATRNGTSTLYWEGVGTVAARGYSTYTFTAPTFQDSTAAGNPYSVFMVDAHPLWPEFYSSSPDSGYSVDNLSPARPAPFAALYVGSGVALHWGKNTERDLSEYRLYRGTGDNFIPGPGNLLAALPDTGYNDPSGSTSFVYKLSAVDIHGNESPFAMVTPDGPTGALASLLSAEVIGSTIRLRWMAAANPGLAATVYRGSPEGDWTALGQVIADGTGIMTWTDAQLVPGQRYGYRIGVWNGASEMLLGETWLEVPALTFALIGMKPNPSSGSALLVSFSLPTAQPARLELFDLAGRRLLGREVGAMGAGQHRVDLSSGTALRAGMYVLRLTQGERTQSVRAVIVK